MQKLLSADDVADVLGTSRRRVYDLAAVRQPGTTRVLPAIHIGRSLRFDPVDVEQWLEEHKQ